MVGESHKSLPPCKGRGHKSFTVIVEESHQSFTFQKKANIFMEQHICHALLWVFYSFPQ